MQNAAVFKTACYHVCFPFNFLCKNANHKKCALSSYCTITYLPIYLNVCMFMSKKYISIFSECCVRVHTVVLCWPWGRVLVRVIRNLPQFPLQAHGILTCLRLILISIRPLEQGKFLCIRTHIFCLSVISSLQTYVLLYQWPFVFSDFCFWLLGWFFWICFLNWVLVRVTEFSEGDNGHFFVYAVVVSWK